MINVPQRHMNTGVEALFPLELALKEYLEDNASEVVNMLAQEWDWDKAFEIKERDTERRVNEQWEARVASIVADKDAKWESVVANKDAEIAALKAKLEGVSFL